MRSGLTTGTCATAAATAAARLLAAPDADAPTSVDVVLPAGDRVLIPVSAAARVDARTARAAVVKDAGDDPDITNGMAVWAEVTLGDTGRGGVRFAAGAGVGTVTRPGLQLDVGEPAINPVPRAMIGSALERVLGEDADVLVTIGVEGGEDVAARTFNPRLGIEGGISIIGTTGRVEPKSTEAWMRSLLPQVDVAAAAGHRVVWVVPGGIGEAYARDALGAPPEAVVHCSNFVGDLLDACRRTADGDDGIERVVLVGHAGKLVKVAAGLFDTHNRAGDARLETVAAIAAAEGASGPLVTRLLRLTTVQAAIAELDAAGLRHVWDAVAARAAVRATERAGLPVEVVLLGYPGELLGTAPGETEGMAAASSDADAPQIVVVGAGPGTEDLVTPAAWREIRRAEVVVGGARLLDAFAPPNAERVEIASHVAAPLQEASAAAREGRRVVVLASGDPGFFGILAAVLRELPDITLRVVPGISSAQVALSRLGESWDGVAVTSAHGREPQGALVVCERNERTIVLVDRHTPPQAFCSALTERGEFEVTVVERAGYPDEGITTARAAAIAEGVFDALSVLFVRTIDTATATRGVGRMGDTDNAARHGKGTS